MFQRRREIELALRKQRLQLRSAALREQLAGHVAALAPAVSLADRARSGWDWIRRHPQLPVLAGAVLLLLRPRRAVRLLRRGLVVWQLVRRLRLWASQRGTDRAAPASVASGAEIHSE